MVRTNRRRILVILTSIVALALGLNMLFYYQLTGSPWPLSHRDKLVAPQQLVGWDRSGIQLANGTMVMPAGMSSLPASSKIIPAFTKEGVEIDKDGKVFGLIRIHHWCGNDPLRDDIRRIELAPVLAYYGEGTSKLKPNMKAREPFSESQYGWSISERVAVKFAFDPRFAELAEDTKPN